MGPPMLQLLAGLVVMMVERGLAQEGVVIGGAEVYEEGQQQQQNKTGGISSVYVCQVGDPSFLGHYVPVDDSIDAGVPTFENEDGRGIWRHQGYWYMGDRTTWPPETYFRCVEGCEYQADSPPLTGYKAGQLHRDITQPPQLQFSPCDGGVFGDAHRSEL